ncbi:hypothetical protein E2C01_084797 [Portunus trituberculatus]|uniref:Uncharacterized protein n=1 Tax=Portunus trituberculatus TaxID=210409 RepID=A0A5B7J8Q3_PORTR|nr:hypothetical protein [Portunus trituberculatus]
MCHVDGTNTLESGTAVGQGSMPSLASHEERQPSAMSLCCEHLPSILTAWAQTQHLKSKQAQRLSTHVGKREPGNVVTHKGIQGRLLWV